MFRRGFPVLLLAALCALPPLSIDMGLPSLPAAAAALHVGPSEAALSVTVFMAGFALSPLIYGALSDAWGRRPLLLAGLALFGVGGVACLFAPTLKWLLLARLLQGAGAGCGPTLAFATTRDQLTGKKLGARLAMLTMLLNIAPVIAPSLGTACLALGGWRGVYAVLATVGILLLLAGLCSFDETQSLANKEKKAVAAKLVYDAGALSRRWEVLFPGLVYGLSAGSMFAYVSISPMLLIERLGASTTLYSALFAVTGAAIMLGALISGRLINRVGPVKLAGAGLVLAVLGPVAAALLLRNEAATVVPVVGAMAVATFGYGLVAPASAHAALGSDPEMAGTISALINSFQMTCMATASLCASLLFGALGSLAPSTLMIGFALVATGCLYGWRRWLGTAVTESRTSCSGSASKA